ncbi:hypothetical protein FHS14_001920 [Paenibacillus baekrokdamisoli]|nr:hypothetical protein [Paenibacillus baekrokdamisoli]
MFRRLNWGLIAALLFCAVCWTFVIDWLLK